MSRVLTVFALIVADTARLLQAANLNLLALHLAVACSLLLSPLLQLPSCTPVRVTRRAQAPKER